MMIDSDVNWDFESQRAFWNKWDGQCLREDTLGEQAIRRGETALSLLQSLKLAGPKILELGCGNGWLAEKLAAFGSITGVDIAEKAIEEAARRVPMGAFYAGDALSLHLPAEEFDVVVTLETFSHVPSQPDFVDLIARVLRPRGYLILLTQNRTVYSRRSDVRPPGEGQLRRWVTMKELRRMLSSRFRIMKAFTIEPAGDLGFLRIVNSRKLKRLVTALVPELTLERFKERAGCGQTLVALARKEP
ncbi:MAG: methyltransferase domain-containing protein [Syntrophobacteraceae bacterium]